LLSAALSPRWLQVASLSRAAERPRRDSITQTARLGDDTIEVGHEEDDDAMTDAATLASAPARRRRLLFCLVVALLHASLVEQLQLEATRRREEPKEASSDDDDDDYEESQETSEDDDDYTEPPTSTSGGNRSKPKAKQPRLKNAYCLRGVEARLAASHRSRPQARPDTGGLRRGEGVHRAEVPAGACCFQ
jgi:hypothetical protein